MHGAPRDDPTLTSLTRRLRAAQTPAEARPWQLLRGRVLAGWKFRRQVPLHDVDFSCPAARLVIELDGAAHDHEGAQGEDRARDRALEGEGYRVLRFENRDVFDHADGV